MRLLETIPKTSPIRRPPWPICNLYVHSATAIIDKRCIAGKIVSFHCIPGEQRWRIALGLESYDLSKPPAVLIEAAMMRHNS
jgi:hypothetical protein